eukprot:278946-Rhodomonas_salina.1
MKERASSLAHSPRTRVHGGDAKEKPAARLADAPQTSHCLPPTRTEFPTPLPVQLGTYSLRPRLSDTLKTLRTHRHSFDPVSNPLSPGCYSLRDFSESESRPMHSTPPDPREPTFKPHQTQLLDYPISLPPLDQASDLEVAPGVEGVGVAPEPRVLDGGEARDGVERAQPPRRIRLSCLQAQVAAGGEPYVSAHGTRRVGCGGRARVVRWKCGARV